MPAATRERQILNTALRTYPTLLLVLLGALDKAAAKLGLRRVPEQTLCGLAVASGTTGALTGALALVLLQHKTRKQSFQLKYLIATGLALAIDIAEHESGAAPRAHRHRHPVCTTKQGELGVADTFG